MNSWNLDRRWEELLRQHWVIYILPPMKVVGESEKRNKEGRRVGKLVEPSNGDVRRYGEWNE
jgi:hypothetical protein